MSYSIGLDIAAGEIRLVQLSKKNSLAIEIKTYAFEHSVTLSQIVQQLNIKNHKVVIAMPYHTVISKRLKLPLNMSAIECEAEIAEHLNQYLPDIREELCFDFIEIAKDEDSQELLLFATRRSLLDTNINVVEAAGLKVSHVDLDVYSFMRGVKWHLNFTQCVVVLNFRKEIQLIVADNNEVILSQSLTMVKSALILAQEIKSILKINSISIQKIEKIILIGEIIFDEDALKNELSIKVIRLVNNVIEFDFLSAFGLALRGDT